MATFIATCNVCGTANRIPEDREGQTGHCGSCRNLLTALYFRPKPLTDSTFDSFIRGYNGPVLAEFWAPWCPHCRVYEANVRSIAEKLAGSAVVVQINTQDNPVLVARFNARSIPVIFLLIQGRIIDQISGAQSSEAIISWFRRHA